eukprot:Nk52_evm75s270 gene=Nk52_evmTU75s270
MGLISHICEEIYTFPEGTDMDSIRQMIVQYANGKEGKRAEYALAEKEDLFKRKGKGHGVENAYIDGVVKNEKKTVFLTHTSLRMKYVDDMAFTFSGNKMKGFSVSRVGVGDFYQNHRNVTQVTKTLVDEQGSPLYTSKVTLKS